MGVPKPSEARIVLRHYEDGRMRAFLGGKIIPGVISLSLSQDGMDRDVLTMSIIGLAVRVETSPLKRTDDPDRNAHEQRNTPLPEVIPDCSNPYGEGIRTTGSGDRPPKPRR